MSRLISENADKTILVLTGSINRLVERLAATECRIFFQMEQIEEKLREITHEL